MRFSLLLCALLAGLLRAAPAPRLAPDDPAWRDLAATFAHQPDATADFSERRTFPFRKAPLELSGISRISATRGLSLHYTAPDERIVVIDEAGMIVRQPDGTVAAADPRATAANAALVHVLRFDLAALALNFDLFGQREGPAWTLTLVPLAADLRRAVSEIVVSGEPAQVRRIVIRRSPTQAVEILVGPARPTPFGADELARFFR